MLSDEQAGRQSSAMPASAASESSADQIRLTNGFYIRGL